ncbi:MAG: amino acid carrier protein, partial [Alphaproteobacteria bacterium]
GGMVQSNSIADIFQNSFGINPVITGVFIVLAVGVVLLGGVSRLGSTADALVPTMIVLYCGYGLVILVLNYTAIPALFSLIFESAFSGHAAVGGFVGSTMASAMRMGFARGIFSNESGLGSASIVAAAAKTKHPTEQALISMTQTFIDTIVVCTMTGLVLLLSGLWSNTGGMAGANLTGQAFSHGLMGLTVMGQDVGKLVVAVALFFFVYTTIIGWGYYGLQCAEYIFGPRITLPYKLFFLLCNFMGAYLLAASDSTPAAVMFAWSASEIGTALLIFPNAVALFWLSPKVKALTADYFAVKHGKQKKYSLKPFANE